MLDVDVHDGEGAVRLVVRGDLDYGSADRLRLAAADVAGSGTLELDLSGVPYMDSTGIAAILGIHSARERAGGALHVVAASPQVERLLRITGIDRVLRAGSD
jgi:anti-sigma B factor antagonist